MERLLPDEPMRNLMDWLPMLPVTSAQQVDYQAADPAVLIVLAEAAETTMNVLHSGIGSIGNLLAHSAVAIEDGSISSDSVEALGHLMAELGALAAGSMVLAARCRRETADYQPT
ncbi:MAG: hypothetical protein CVU24_00460 [Betaproteobacteria bacterium HGW-Betaproteobacteria-18]|nr:MAG: hypothetical protein CVU24_00460 [Betaproteobacteria bacterium HGW-Betaproteobacteria-18]